MDVYERELVRMIVRWAPYGGPTDDEVFCEFGLHLAEVRIRFRRIVEDEIRHADELTDLDRELLFKARSLMIGCDRPRINARLGGENRGAFWPAIDAKLR